MHKLSIIDWPQACEWTFKFFVGYFHARRDDMN